MSETTAWSSSIRGLLFAWDSRDVSPDCGLLQVALPWPGGPEAGDGGASDGEAIIIPLCVELVSEMTLDDLGFTLTYTAPSAGLVHQQHNRKAAEAMEEASRGLGCTFERAESAKAVETLTVTELDGPALESLMSALQESSYAEHQEGPATVFTLTEADEAGSRISDSHAFIGTAWVSQVGREDEPQDGAPRLMRDALAAVRDGNPQL